MASIDQKMLAFEYLIDQFILWHREIVPSHDIPKDFSILKLIKLNFFATAVTATPIDQGLLTLFDDFHALPLGHVESEVYSNKLKLRRYEFKGRQLVYKKGVEQVTDYSLISDFLNPLNDAISMLKFENYNLISHNPMTLVDISHRWYSWKYSYRKARINGRRSMSIDPFLIQQDIKFFTL